MSHADTCAVGRRLHLELLSREELGQIHETTLDVLENVGVCYHSAQALDVLEAHGADVNRTTTVAKIPGELAERALTTLPNQFVLGSRNPEFDLPLDGEHVYLSTDGCGVLVREADGSVRPSCKADVRLTAHLAQQLEHVSTTSAIVAALDCPPATRALHELDACLRGSEKHSIVVSVKDTREALGLLRMAEAVAGGREELRRRPLFTAIICTVSPLHQERYGMDLALTLAAAGIPVSFYPMPIVGATAPATLAGAAVVANAEMLSATIVTQLAHPGAKIIHGGGPTTMNMSTGAYGSNAPEALLLRAAIGQIADYYGMPSWFGSGATLAKTPGSQSAGENTLAMLMAYLNGADVTFGTGLLDGSRMLCLENIAIDDEVMSVVKRLLRGVTVNAETLAVELIKEMACSGSYLTANHTRRHAHELWREALGEDRPHQIGHDGGAPSTVARARERVDLLCAAAPVDFPHDLAAELDAIIAATEAEAAKR